MPPRSGPVTFIEKEAESSDSKASCPNCGGHLPADAVVCAACGYDKRSGRQLHTSLGQEEGVSTSRAGRSFSHRAPPPASRERRSAVNDNRPVPEQRTRRKLKVLLVLALTLITALIALETYTQEVGLVEALDKGMVSIKFSLVEAGDVVPVGGTEVERQFGRRCRGGHTRWRLSKLSRFPTTAKLRIRAGTILGIRGNHFFPGRELYVVMDDAYVRLKNENSPQDVTLHTALLLT